MPFLHYLRATIEEKKEQRITNEYIAEALKTVVHNTAQDKGGYTLNKTLSEILRAASAKPELRTADEIKDHFKELLGGE